MGHPAWVLAVLDRFDARALQMFPDPKIEDVDYKTFGDGRQWADVLVSFGRGNKRDSTILIAFEPISEPVASFTRGD